VIIELRRQMDHPLCDYCAKTSGLLFLDHWVKTTDGLLIMVVEVRLLILRDHWIKTRGGSSILRLLH